MKTLIKNIIPALLTTLTLSSQAETPLKIYRGEQDTVYKANHIIVGVTSPGNKATINNREVHVYKTGSFGREVSLKEGKNIITVSAINKNDTTSHSFNVFYSTTKPKQQQELPTTETPVSLYLKTTEGAYMQYGNGGDRLGGSKMGYLDANITVKAIAETKSLYKVQLSQNRFAYIPKDKLTDCNDSTSQVNSGSWHISNRGKYDQISISLPKRLPYHSWTQLDPTTIMVNIYGTTNNSNWITQKDQLGMVDYVDYRQIDSDVLQVIIKLKEKYSWGYSIGYDNNNLTIKIKHTPPLELKSLVIGLDAGHGGEYPGALSPSGLKESVVNLDMIMRIKEILEEKGATVILSRDDDYNVTMDGRKQKFINNNIDLMISLHNNSGGSPLNEMGTSTYYKHISNRELASCMLNRLLELGVKNFGLTGNFNFSLNAPTEFPNVLLEILFMSSLPEEEMLADQTFRQQVAEKAVLGLEDYLQKVKISLK